MVGLTLTGEPPGGVTHWTTRTLAAQVGVGKDTVAQIWADHRLQPWRVDASTGTLTPNPYLEGHRDEIIERVPGAAKPSTRSNRRRTTSASRSIRSSSVGEKMNGRTAFRGTSEAVISSWL